MEREPLNIVQHGELIVALLVSFIGVAARARVDRKNIVKLVLEIFSPTWKKGLERAVLSINDKSGFHSLKGI